MTQGTAIPSVYVAVNKPDGTVLNNLSNIYCTAGGSGCVLPLMNLPQSGTYTVIVTTYSWTETFSLTATLSSDVTGMLTSGTAMPVTLGTMGQNALLSFTATGGQNVALTVNSVATTPTGVSEQILVYNASNSQVGSTSTASATTLNLTNLPAGSYRVLIYPSSTATGSLQVRYQ